MSKTIHTPHGPRRLGRLPGRFDPRTWSAGMALRNALPVVPDAVNWRPAGTWPMWGNDQIGCCTQVSVASAILTWTQAAQVPVLLSDDQVIGNYSAESGYVPGEPQTDQGAVELDVLNRWSRDGYVIPGSQPGRSYLTAYAAVNPIDLDQVRRSIAFLGGCYLGLSLPEWCVQTDGDWSANPALDNTIIGGHAVWCHGYCQDWLYLNTWGSDKRMSWDFFRTFCDEAYALVSRQHWSDIHGVSPKGEALDAMVTEMRG